MELLETWITPALATGLLAYSVAVTLLTNWLARKLRRSPIPPERSAATITADSVWILLVFAAGLLAARYIERVPSAGLGFLAYGLVALFLSLVRGLLYQRAREQQVRDEFDVEELASELVNSLTYVLAAIVVYLSLSLLLQQPVDPVLFVPLCLGALLPDLDSRKTIPGRVLQPISRRLEGRFGRGQEWHSLTANAAVGLAAAPLIPFTSVQAWYLIPFGFLTHLLVDLFSSKGVMLLWPISRTRYRISTGFAQKRRGLSKRTLAAVLAVAAVVLLVAVDIGRAPAVPPGPAPSYEATVERYYSLRGRRLVYASIEGTWQATGRRIVDRFEVLNASGQSVTMLDRYTGKVFSAGRSASDNLYLNRISIQEGASSRVKPVEVELQAQRIADALPVLYEMQREPGLQHIFVSGDVVLAGDQDEPELTLRPDYAQTRLRRIQEHPDGHFSLHYLTAAELIELANLWVETGELSIVATYASPPSGPTVTPLPSP